MSQKKTINPLSLEITKAGNANGISLQLQKVLESGEIRSLTEKEKSRIIKDAAKHYAKFLEALGVDWAEDANSNDTAHRVAKAYVNELWAGRYNILSPITTFPSDGYSGIVLETGIDLTSMCSHHHQLIKGNVSIAYIPGEEKLVIGLSKLNRICEHFGRRGAIQEQLTKAIHSAVDTSITGNKGVMVVVTATHGCVSCRGVKHQGASMITSAVSGVFLDSNDTAKQEVLELLKMKL